MKIKLLTLFLMLCAVGFGSQQMVAAPVTGEVQTLSHRHRALCIATQTNDPAFNIYEQFLREGVICEVTTWEWFTQNESSAESNYDVLVFSNFYGRFDYVGVMLDSESSVTAAQVEDALVAWQAAGKKFLMFHYTETGGDEDTKGVFKLDIDAAISTSERFYDSLEQLNMFGYSYTPATHGLFKAGIVNNAEAAYFGGEFLIDTEKFGNDIYTHTDEQSGVNLRTTANDNRPATAVDLVQVVDKDDVARAGNYATLAYVIIDEGVMKSIHYTRLSHKPSSADSHVPSKSSTFFNTGVATRHLIGNNSLVKLAMDCKNSKKIAAYGIDGDPRYVATPGVTSFSESPTNTGKLRIEHIASGEFNEGVEFYMTQAGIYTGFHTVLDEISTTVADTTTSWTAAESETAGGMYIGFATYQDEGLTPFIDGFNSGGANRKLEIGLVGMALNSDLSDYYDSVDAANIQWNSHSWSHWQDLIIETEEVVLDSSQLHTLQIPYHPVLSSITASETGTISSGDGWFESVAADEYTWDYGNQYRFHADLVGETLTFVYRHYADHELEWIGSIAAIQSKVGVDIDNSIYLTGKTGTAFTSIDADDYTSNVQWSEQDLDEHQRIRYLLSLRESNGDRVLDKVRPMVSLYWRDWDSLVAYDGQMTPNTWDAAQNIDTFADNDNSNGTTITVDSHGFTTGDKVKIENAGAPFDGEWVIFHVRDNTFDIPVTFTADPDNDTETVKRAGILTQAAAEIAHCKAYNMPMVSYTHPFHFGPNGYHASSVYYEGGSTHEDWRDGLDMDDPDDKAITTAAAVASIDGWCDLIDAENAEWMWRSDVNTYWDYLNQYVDYEADVVRSSNVIYVRNKGNQEVEGLTFRVMTDSDNIQKVILNYSGKAYPYQELAVTEYNGESLFSFDLKPSQNVTIKVIGDLL